ncbi:MAG: hypothetical protein Q8R65_05150 [Polynucleobacter sp.]|nr:hypothetical protein [Polynucleobacter sp.]MDZ4057225.1 hypothetical protein [Polynucleobacter sp.]
MDDRELLIPAVQQEAPVPNAQTRRGRIQMLLLLFACAVPVMASYFTFYVLKPEGGKTNYGSLVTPPELAQPAWFNVPLEGKWTMLVARPAAECVPSNEACLQALFLMRQVRIALGKESPRMQLIWVVTDGNPVDSEVRKAYDETTAGFLIVNAPSGGEAKSQWEAWLNRNQGGADIQLLNPFGEKMMQFAVTSNPKEFAGMRKDLEKLLKLNRAGEKSQ